MEKMSPKIWTAIPATTKAALAPALNKKSAEVTITHPAASKRNPAILMYSHTFFI